MYKVLVVEDEKGILDILELYLKKEGYEAHCFSDPLKALEEFSNISPDIAVLDVMMPGMNGCELLEEIRKISTIPVLMLTATVDEHSRIKGLDTGADDYVLKPFSPKELMARVRANLRRNSKPAFIEDFDGRIKIHSESRDFFLDDQLVKLTKTEFDIVRYLMDNKGRVISRDQLITAVLGIGYEGYDRTIDVHIKNLRQKIEKDGLKAIETVYGVGYRWMGNE